MQSDSHKRNGTGWIIDSYKDSSLRRFAMWEFKEDSSQIQAETAFYLFLLGGSYILNRPRGLNWPRGLSVKVYTKEEQQLFPEGVLASRIAVGVSSAVG